MIAKACALAIPTVLLATGCAAPTDLDRPPEVPLPEDGWPAIANGNEGMAAMSGLLLPSFREVAARWLLPATSPWAPYQKTTLLAALDESERVASLPSLEELDDVNDAREAANMVATVGLPADTMWIVDLRGAASVAFGAALSLATTEPVAPVLTFNNWPAEHEVVPAEETLAGLISMQPRRSGRADGQPVFLLDAWRLAYRDVPPEDDRTDNRYMLTAADFPAADVLLSRGIRRVIYVVESCESASREEDDLHATFVAYRAAGIAVDIVDLEVLESIDPDEPWRDLVCGEWSLSVDPNRGTLVTDPTFYSRARGGFGGPHAIHVGGHGPGFGHIFGHGGG
jgi:hypothetical protein